MLTDSRAITDADVAAETQRCEQLVALMEHGVTQRQASLLLWSDLRAEA